MKYQKLLPLLLLLVVAVPASYLANSETSNTSAVLNALRLQGTNSSLQNSTYSSIPVNSEFQNIQLNTQKIIKIDGRCIDTQFYKQYLPYQKQIIEQNLAELKTYHAAYDAKFKRLLYVVTKKFANGTKKGQASLDTLKKIIDGGIRSNDIHHYKPLKDFLENQALNRNTLANSYCKDFDDYTTAYSKFEETEITLKLYPSILEIFYPESVVLDNLIELIEFRINLE